jgi:hypothetical protein
MFAVALFAAAACCRTARIDAVITDASSSDVIVKLLDINKFSVLDTVAVDTDGKFSYKVEVREGSLNSSIFSMVIRRWLP